MNGGQHKLFDNNPIPPGDHLRMKLKEKQWTQEDLASITGRSCTQINDIVTGKRGITPEMAVALGAALGTSADYWLKIDAMHRLSLVKSDTEEVQRRAKLLDIAPIKEMQRRGWIRATKNLDELEAELRKFFGVQSLETEPEFPIAARKTTPLSDLTPAQRAWCFRARELATCITIPKDAKPFTSEQLVHQLRRLAAYPKEVRDLPETLAQYGIRFVVVEPLPGAKIDGAVFWLDDSSPVIAVSIRFDRIDAFWYTVMHEVSHVRHEDSLSIDTDLTVDGTVSSLMKEGIEQRADKEAAETLVPADKLDSFIRRVGPLYSKPRIIQFAHTIKMHPGIIVGQLQHLGELGYSAHRPLLVKIRHLVSEVALTDGWGRTISPGAL